MTFEMSITLGSLINILGMMITLLLLVVKITRFTVAFERRIDKLEMTINAQGDYVQRLESVTKADLARLDAMNEKCYVKELIKEHDKDIDNIEKSQVSLRAQLPLQISAMQASITELSTEVKGLRADIAARRATD